MSYVVGSKVKEHNKKKGCNTAGDFMTALHELVEWNAKKACERAKANGRVTVRSTDVCMCGKSGASGNYVVGSKLKEHNKKVKCNTAGDYLDAMNATVSKKLDNACERAKANGRKTVRGYDL